MSQYLKTPLRYPGGKSRAIDSILKYIPRNAKNYIFPFCGGCSIELATFNLISKHVYAYDLFPPLVNFWQSLTKYNNKLIKVIESLYPLSKEKFYELQETSVDMDDKIMQGACFYALNRCSFSGTTHSGGYSQEAADKRFTRHGIEMLQLFNGIDFNVELMDYKESIEKHTDSWGYYDPPYLIGSNYIYGFSGHLHKQFSHTDFHNLISNKEHWLLSYNDCTEIRELYKDHKIITPSWLYGMGEEKESKEVLIFSKDIPKDVSKQRVSYQQRGLY
jgi:DNA adenine methylase